jgi:hypothetical protein
MTAAIHIFVMLACLLAVVEVVVQGCTVEGGPIISLNKKSTSYIPICVILNDQTLFATQVKFDVLSRIVIKDSFKQVTTPDACLTTPMWFSRGCDWDAAGSYGLGIGYGAPTNFYVSVGGVSSLYRKRYAYLQGTSVAAVFPIVTLVIQVDGGKVTSVYWDDDCYFNEGGTQAFSTFNMLTCRFNAYDLSTNGGNVTFQRYLNPSRETTLGFDTSVTKSFCEAPAGSNQEQIPPGFCDLGIYVVWVGTSADSQQLTSAGQRFRRFRDYAMPNQYLMMLNSSGNSLPQTTIAPTTV